MPNLVAGIHQAIAGRIFALVSKLKVKPDVAVTGGGAKNIGLVKALEAKFGCPVLVPAEPLITGALAQPWLDGRCARKASKTGVHPCHKAAHLGEAGLF